MTKPALMIGLGEVLWDILPSGKVLGGAPANFACMTSVLGDEGIVASRVGHDELGREAWALMHLGLSSAYLQQDQHETGTASVSIDDGGQPNFAIRESVAWDFLQWTAEWEELSSRADVICFGSLAQRSAISAATIERFLRNAPNALRICDVNLRQSFYNEDVLRRRGAQRLPSTPANCKAFWRAPFAEAPAACRVAAFIENSSAQATNLFGAIGK